MLARSELPICTQRNGMQHNDSAGRGLSDVIGVSERKNGKSVVGMEQKNISKIAKKQKLFSLIYST